MEADVYRQFEQLEQRHWWFRGRRRVYFELIDKLLQGSQPASVLDLGCGVGGFLDGLSARGGNVVACDVDHNSLGRCRSRGHLQCVQSPSDHLPFASASFDLVCMFDVLEHTPDDHRALREIWRVMKPGATLVLTVPAYQFLYANNDRVAGHYRRYHRQGLRAVLDAAEFTELRSTYCNVLLLPFIVIAVLASKCVEYALGRKRDLGHSNLDWPAPTLLNNTLYSLFAAELIVSRHLDWPVGHSLFAAAKKPASP